MTHNKNKQVANPMHTIGAITAVAAISIGTITPLAIAEDTSIQNPQGDNTGTSEEQTTTRTYTVEIDGTSTTLTKDGNTYTGTINDYNGIPPQEINAISTDETPIIVKLAGQDTPSEQTGTMTYSGTNGEDAIKLTVNYIKPVTVYTGTLNGISKQFTVEADGSQSLSFDSLNSHPGNLQVTGGGNDFTLTATNIHSSSQGTKLGTINVKGTATYNQIATSALPSFAATAEYSYMVGSEVTIDDNSRFTKQGDVYKATDSNFTLDNTNRPDSSIIKLSNGISVPITWDNATETVEKDNGNGGTATYVRLSGHAEGTLTVTDSATGEKQTEKYEIETIADRAQDKSFLGMTVTQTNAKGDTTTLTVDKFDSATHEYTLAALPYSQIGDAFALNVNKGVDAEASTPVLTLGDNASRVFTVTVNGEQYKVTIPFQSADIKADSAAKLTGIYVNYDGTAEQGQLIDDWNPNRLDYVIQLTADQKSPYVLPVAPDGVSIQAGNVTQSAQSVRQEWKVTDDASGETRIYSVTATRPVKTAVSEFKPSDPVKQDSTVDSTTDKDADLASHGYVDKDGKYVKVETDEYTVPEGATFSYEPKNGQSATVTSTHEATTYTYTVTVLPKDSNAFPKQHVYKVTYLTSQTHLAELTGIGVDGSLINGFDKDKHEYTVAVNDVNEWVVTPQYDKTTGMTVSTVKDGQDAIITVTSGDGLVTAVYKVHVTQKLFGGAGSSGIGGDLASTGSSVMTIVMSALLFVVAAFSLFVVGRKSKKNKPEVASDINETGETDDNN